MENVLSRIKIIADNEGITLTMLEKNIGASKGVLTKALAKNTDIQSKWVTLVAENYPHYSAKWILTGKGPMRLEKDENQDEKAIGTLLEVIKEKAYLIDLQKKRIMELEDKTKFFELYFPEGLSKAKYELEKKKV